MLDEGHSGPDVFQSIIRTSSWSLSRATPAAVMQALQNLVVPVGAPFSGYLSELRILVADVKVCGPCSSGGWQNADCHQNRGRMTNFLI